MHKSIYLLFIILFCLVKESNAQTNITAHKWQTPTGKACYIAKFDAPINTVLEVEYNSKTIFVEIVERLSDSTLIELSECAWEKLGLSPYNTTANLEINIRDSENGITVNLPKKVDSSQSNDVITNQNSTYTQPAYNNPYQLEIQDNTSTTTEDPFGTLNDNSTNTVNSFERLNDNNLQPSPSSQATSNITERGYAESVSIPDSPPFVALHRTASIGTMMIVKNPITGANAVVEVVGQIQDVYPSAGVIIQLTSTAFSRLGDNSNNILEVELNYTGLPNNITLDSTNKRSHTEKVKVEAFQSNNIVDEAIALHPSIPPGTMIYLKHPNQKEIPLTVMGKPKNNSKALQVSDTLYNTLEIIKNQSNWSIEYNDFQSKNNFEIYANVFEEVSAVRRSNTSEKMAIWHKTIPVGTSVLIKNLVSIDRYGHKQFSTKLVKIVGKLEESEEEDIQLSPDVWQAITSSSTNSINSGISKSRENEDELALYLSYFSL